MLNEQEAKKLQAITQRVLVEIEQALEGVSQRWPEFRIAGYIDVWASNNSLWKLGIAHIRSDPNKPAETQAYDMNRWPDFAPIGREMLAEIDKNVVP